ncbi:hypothetical protein KCP78_05940 [Salmonella enterica subsp. enterica]|nr:hypothetical protein KCP78_05940 [Salmonella enterica subsp. enterica]
MEGNGCWCGCLSYGRHDHCRRIGQSGVALKRSNKVNGSAGEIAARRQPRCVFTAQMRDLRSGRYPGSWR